MSSAHESAGSSADARERTAHDIAELVRARGWATLDGLYDPPALRAIADTLDALRARFSPPALTAREPIWLADTVEIAGPGLAIYQLLRHAPELAPRLFRAPAVAVLRALLGDDLHLELVGAVQSDATRPFTEWETHLGGIDDERLRRAGERPRRTEVQRVVHFLFLDDQSEPDLGPWQVLPRAVGDPVDPPGSIHEPDWPGAVTLELRAGTVLLLDESVWHSVRPRSRPGLRRFVGAYFASASAPPTAGRDTSLDALPPLDPLFDSLLAHRRA